MPDLLPNDPFAISIPHVTPILPDALGRRPIAVLFVHGMWHGAWCWEQMARYLAAQGIACYLLELPGHGKRQEKEKLKGLTLGRYAREVARVAEALHANLPAGTKLVWAGHSMGGAVLQKCLEWETVPLPDGLVLFASVPHTGAWSTTWGLTREGYLWPVVHATLRGNLLVLLGDAQQTKDLLFSPPMPLGTIAAYRQEGKLQQDSFLAFVDMLLMGCHGTRRAQRLQGRLAAAGVQVLVLEAEKDKIIPTNSTAKMVDIYQAEHHPFPLAHDLMLDVGEGNSWQAVADYLYRWVV